MTGKRKKINHASSFSKILLTLMEEKKMTVRKAAELAGVGTSTLNSWRSGALPEDYLAVKRLAHGLGVTLSFLLTGEDDARMNSGPPLVAEVFEDGGMLFDGFAKISIQRLVPKGGKG
jgi:transcriptional regulator with XRE-family HTH domain